MINIIITPLSSPACGDSQMIRYNAAGVYWATVHNAPRVHYMDSLNNKIVAPSCSPEKNTADICCYAVFLGNKITAFRHMTAIRRAKTPPKLIIAFGPFASEFPQEIISRGLADIVVHNDPEFVVPLLIKAFREKNTWKEIPNISFSNKNVLFTTKKVSFHDLDSIPPVASFLCDQGHPVGLIMTARGCQYHCVHCDRNTIWGGGIRHRSIGHIASEVQNLVENKKVQRILFLDEDLAADQKRLIELCESMRRIKKDFSWHCSACVHSVNEKILLLMGHSRCREIHFGVESASSDVLRRIGKIYGRQEILNAVRWSQNAGIKVEVLITMGNLGETEADRQLTLAVLRDMGPRVTITTNRVVILPGTPLYRKGIREGWFTQQSFFEDEGLIYYDEKERV